MSFVNGLVVNAAKDGVLPSQAGLLLNQIKLDTTLLAVNNGDISGGEAGHDTLVGRNIILRLAANREIPLTEETRQIMSVDGTGLICTVDSDWITPPLLGDLYHVSYTAFDGFGPVRPGAHFFAISSQLKIGNGLTFSYFSISDGYGIKTFDAQSTTLADVFVSALGRLDIGSRLLARDTSGTLLPEQDASLFGGQLNLASGENQQTDGLLGFGTANGSIVLFHNAFVQSSRDVEYDFNGVTGYFKDTTFFSSSSVFIMIKPRAFYNMIPASSLDQIPIMENVTFIGKGLTTDTFIITSGNLAFGNIKKLTLIATAGIILFNLSGTSGFLRVFIRQYSGIGNLVDFRLINHIDLSPEIMILVDPVLFTPSETTLNFVSVTGVDFGGHAGSAVVECWLTDISVSDITGSPIGLAKVYARNTQVKTVSLEHAKTVDAVTGKTFFVGLEEVFHLKYPLTPLIAQTLGPWDMQIFRYGFIPVTVPLNFINTSLQVDVILLPEDTVTLTSVVALTLTGIIPKFTGNYGRAANTLCLDNITIGSSIGSSKFAFGQILGTLSGATAKILFSSSTTVTDLGTLPFADNSTHTTLLLRDQVGIFQDNESITLENFLLGNVNEPISLNPDSIIKHVSVVNPLTVGQVITGGSGATGTLTEDIGSGDSLLTGRNNVSFIAGETVTDLLGGSVVLANPLTEYRFSWEIDCGGHPLSDVLQHIDAQMDQMPVTGIYIDVMDQRTRLLEVSGTDFFTNVIDNKGVVLFNRGGGNVSHLTDDTGLQYTYPVAVNFVLNGLVLNSQVYVEATAGGSMGVGSVIFGPELSATSTYTKNFVYTGDQPFRGMIAFSTTAPYYKPFPFTGIIMSAGFTLNVSQSLDQ